MSQSERTAQMKNAMRFIAASIAAAAISIAAIAIPAAASPAPASPTCWHPGWRSINHESLKTFAADNSSTIAVTLADTAECKPGGWGIRLVDYLNRGNLAKPLPDGVWLWPRTTLKIDSSG